MFDCVSMIILAIILVTIVALLLEIKLTAILALMVAVYVVTGLSYITPFPEGYLSYKRHLIQRNFWLYYKQKRADKVILIVLRILILCLLVLVLIILAIWSYFDFYNSYYLAKAIVKFFNFFFKKDYRHLSNAIFIMTLWDNFVCWFWPHTLLVYWIFLYLLCINWLHKMSMDRPKTNGIDSEFGDYLREKYKKILEKNKDKKIYNSLEKKKDLDKPKLKRRELRVLELKQRELRELEKKKDLDKPKPRRKECKKINKL